jgi:hypothetical protein
MPRFSALMPGGRESNFDTRVPGWGRATEMKMLFLGLMVAFTPSLLVLAWTLRRAPKNRLAPEAYTEPNKYLAPGDTQKA